MNPYLMISYIGNGNTGMDVDCAGCIGGFCEIDDFEEEYDFGIFENLDINQIKEALLQKITEIIILFKRKINH